MKDILVSPLVFWKPLMVAILPRMPPAINQCSVEKLRGYLASRAAASAVEAEAVDRSARRAAPAGIRWAAVRCGWVLHLAVVGCGRVTPASHQKDAHFAFDF